MSVVSKILPGSAWMHSYDSYVLLGLASFFFFQFRCQQIGSLNPTRDKSGHVHSLSYGPEPNLDVYVRSLSYDPVSIWPRIWWSESTLALYSSQMSVRFRVNIRILSVQARPLSRPNKDKRKPKCANCRGLDVASYRGCPAYKDQAFRQHVVQKQVSYASLLKEASPPPSPPPATHLISLPNKLFPW